jgi:hypothetical protein
LRETGTDDISCQITKFGFIIRLNPVTNIYMKTGVALEKHVLNNGIIYFKEMLLELNRHGKESFCCVVMIIHLT